MESNNKTDFEDSKQYLVQAMAGSLKVCMDFLCLAKFQLSLVVKAHTSQVKPSIFCPSPAEGEVAPELTGRAGVESTYLNPG